ncbi:MAG: glycerophosphodiester phosphodiesterase [Clostridiaceae bacterium]|nr:glycerophosphodiester phosphodiesterase [Clostridiaceae bacterium]
MRTKIFAHRGVRKYHAENTMTAFKAAEAMGLDGIELDVQRAADGQLVICHDENLARLTGQDLWLKDLTYQELSQLNISHYFPGSPRERAPLLDEFLAWFKTSSMVVNLELKNTVIPYEGMEEAVLDMVDRHGLRDRVIISSFSLESAALFKQLAPDMDVGFLYQKMPPSFVRKALRHELDAIHPFYANQLWPWLIRQAHRQGLKVRIWTVNHPLFIRNALWRGADVIMTDDPQLVLNIRDGKSRKGYSADRNN